MSVSPSSPSWKVSLIPFVALVVSMVCVVRVFGADALEGGSQLALLFSAAVAICISMLFYKTPWHAFEEAIAGNIRSIGPSIVILMLIGAIAGSWMVSGIVPTLIFYGIKVISPKIFLFATCIICALVSMMTGSSWTTIATIGVALIGIGDAQGYSAGWTAGAIISGAYFGDKISPLSDTTVLASSCSGTKLFDHIRYMMITTVPSVSIALVIFLVASLTHQSGDVSRIKEFSAALQGAFRISPWLLLVPVVTGVMIAKRLPAMVTLFMSALIAGIVALFSQPDIIWSIATGEARSAFNGLDFTSGFHGLAVAYYGDTSVETGDEMLNSLVSTSGMNGMLSTIFLIICATTFGGSMSGSGMIQSITEMLTRKVNSRTSMVSSTVATGIASNVMMGDQYLSIMMICSLFKGLYEEKGYESRLLSRSAEDSATVTSVLIPWNSCGMTQATVLKVPTLTYLPYCFFNIISPMMSIFIAAIGFKITRKALKND